MIIYIKLTKLSLLLSLLILEPIPSCPSYLRILLNATCTTLLAQKLSRTIGSHRLMFKRKAHWKTSTVILFSIPTFILPLIPILIVIVIFIRCSEEKYVIFTLPHFSDLKSASKNMLIYFLETERTQELFHNFTLLKKITQVSLA